MQGLTIPARFERVVRETPAALAVKIRRDAVRYAELDAFANRIARALRQLAPGAPEPVALSFNEQSIHAIAAILGVLKARHIYVPLDCAAPASGPTLGEIGARIVLTDRATATDPRLPRRESSATTLEVDAIAGPSHALELPSAPDDPAYIFYTSGSTGRPKGVVDTHRNVLHNITRYTDALRITAADKLTLLQAIHFSGSVSSLFCALLNGGTVCPFSLHAEGLERVNAWLCEEAVTIYHSVPAIFRSWVGTGDVPSALRVVRLEGDLASKRDVELFRRHLPSSCILAHGLGATETGLSCQLQLTTGDEVAGVVPIGRPLPDMQLRIVDDNGEEVATGSCGEIAVRSRFLAVGYWRDDELTRQRFSADRTGGDGRIYRTGDLGRVGADGNVEYLGRKDAVEKINGRHVQPAEIEAALVGIDGVREAAVATHRDPRGEAVLVAYLVVRDGVQLSLSEVRAHLLATLAPHMVPRRLVTLARLPLDGNGKVDRRALPAPGQPAALVPDRFDDPMHAELARLWSEVLGGVVVGLHDDFFALGGDSLAAVRLSALIAGRLGRPLRPEILLQARTVAALAAQLGGTHPSVGDETLFVVPSRTGGELQFAHLARYLDVHCLATDGVMERCEFDIPATAAACVRALRDRKPRGPYRLGGVCFGALIAYEMAQQLTAAGEPVREVLLFAVRPAELRRLMPAALLRRQWLFEQWETFRSRQGLRRAARRVADRLRAPGGETARWQRRCSTERYAPAPLHTHVAFFIARDDAWIFSSEPAAHLRRLGRGDVAVHIVSGGRHTFLDPRHVADTAAILRAR